MASKPQPPGPLSKAVYVRDTPLDQYPLAKGGAGSPRDAAPLGNAVTKGIPSSGEGSRNRRSENDVTEQMQQRLAEFALRFPGLRNRLVTIIKAQRAKELFEDLTRSANEGSAKNSTRLSSDYDIQKFLNDLSTLEGAAATPGEIEEGQIKSDEQRTELQLLEGYFDFHDVPESAREALVGKFRIEVGIAVPRVTPARGHHHVKGPDLPSFHKPPLLKTRHRTPSAELDAQVKDLDRVRAAQQLLTTYQRRKGVELCDAEIEQLRAARRLVRAYERRTPSPG